MSFDVYKTATSLRDRATMVGLDIDALEFALYALGVIGDGGSGSLASDALDEIEARIVAAEREKNGTALRAVPDG